ncbi:MAG: hypothetical protein J7J99_03240 [Thermoprotei archaeon]|nr:hypothetical protein [Thermoprotei archaeon]
MALLKMVEEHLRKAFRLLFMKGGMFIADIFTNALENIKSYVEYLKRSCG